MAREFLLKGRLKGIENDHGTYYALISLYELDGCNASGDLKIHCGEDMEDIFFTEQPSSIQVRLKASVYKVVEDVHRYSDVPPDYVLSVQMDSPDFMVPLDITTFDSEGNPLSKPELWKPKMSDFATDKAKKAPKLRLEDLDPNKMHGAADGFGGSDYE